MRNRAKCKKCGDILESFHQHDYVTCKCGEISIDGGNYSFSASAKDWSNFLRVDDEGNEIVPKVIDKDLETPKEEPVNLTKKDLMDQLIAMAMNIERLPANAMQLPITHYDFMHALLLIAAIFKED